MIRFLMARDGDLGGRRTDRAFLAVDAYLEIAKKHGIDQVHMALAWCMNCQFMASVIFGATTMKQLDQVLGCVDVALSDEILREINTAHRMHPMPY